MFVLILLITFFVSISQIILLNKIRKTYKNINSIFINRELIKIIFEKGIVEEQQIENLNYDTKLFIKYLSRISTYLKNNTNFNIVKNYISDFFENYINNINIYANKAPAIGLIFTFIGMILMLYELYSVNLIYVSQIKSIISNLYPVFIGSVLGISNYVYGIYLIKKINQKKRDIVEEYLDIYIQLLEESENIYPKDIDSAYKKILRSISKLTNELNNIRLGFENFNLNLTNHNKAIETNISNLISLSEINYSRFDEISKSILEKFSYNTEIISSNVQKLNQYISIFERFSPVLSNLIKQSESLSLNFQKTDLIINSFLEVTSKFNSISNELSEYNKQFSNALEFVKNYELNLKTFNNFINMLNDSFRDFINKLPSDLLSLLVNNFNDLKIIMADIKNNGSSDNNFKDFENVLIRMENNTKTLVENINKTTIALMDIQKKLLNINQIEYQIQDGQKKTNEQPKSLMKRFIKILKFKLKMK